MPGPSGSIWNDILDTDHAVIIRTYVERWPQRDRPPEKILIVVVEPDKETRLSQPAADSRPGDDQVGPPMALMKSNC